MIEHVCPICGEIVDLCDDDFMAYNGEYYHQECFDDNFTMCQDCGEYVSNDEITYLSRYGKYVCDDCMEKNYCKCCNCDEILDESDIYWGADELPYCEDCWSEYFTTCDDCGTTIYRDDARFTDWHVYCSDCYDRQFGVIHEYHDDDVEYYPRYLDDVDRNEHYRELYGLELEIGDNNLTTAEDLLNVMTEDNIVLMHDGSVDGYEMISMPLSRRYFYEKFVPLLDNGLRILRNGGATGHGSGGIHIHFKQFDRGLQTANAVQILYGDIADQKIWLDISQRNQFSLDRWASMRNNLQTPKDILEHNWRTAIGENNYHGTALNYDTRTETHELRIFNSNLRLERVIKNMECLFALEDYVHSLTDLTGTTRGFLEYALEHHDRYKYFIDFLFEKNIINKAMKFYFDFKIPEDLTMEVLNHVVIDDIDTEYTEA